jgi:hypothetical protein
MSTVNARPVVSSVEELLSGAASREPFSPADGKSETEMERVVIDGEPFVLKHLDHRRDWIMRSTGDLACRPVVVWRSGLLDALPACIDSTTVGASWDGTAGAILMRDVGDHLVPEGDAEIPLDQHLRFLDHMASLHATFWGWRDTIGLASLEQRYAAFHPVLPEIEGRLGGTAAVPTRYVPLGWQRFVERAPGAAAVVMPLLDDLGPLVDALRSTPQTLIHSDWKAGNLGSHPDGRTILLDWAVPGEAPACTEIAWYVALNRARIPQSKDAAIQEFRAALERHGVDTGPWWEGQLSLCLLGALVQFGWEKALGERDDGAEELAWWTERALEGARLLA